jgi:hypothetical protein
MTDEREPSIATSRPWGDHRLELDRVHEFSLGPLRLLALRTADEWRIAWEVAFDRANEALASGTSSSAPAAPDEEPNWHRYIVGREELPLRFEPVMPDRPVVARPEETIGIPGGRGARLRVAVPVWVRILVGQGAAAVRLCEVPSMILSKTWFGESHSGELCYSLEKAVSREAPTSGGPDHLVMCPVDVKNISREALDLQRICLRVPHLSIHEGDDGLRAGRTLVKYRGTGRSAEVTHDQSPSGGGDHGSRLSLPRVPEERSVVRRTFTHLRSWFGG